ncbi:MAG: hypothetical protein Kow0063_07600 [Anaerolineae bacterium]
MKNWFFSLKGAIALSVMALLTEVWRAFLDAMFVLPIDFGDAGMMQTFALIATLIFALWVWSLVAAARGSRFGLVAAFALNALIVLAVPVSWLLVYCPAECRAQAGIFNLANTLNLVLGLLAAVSLGWQLRRSARPALAEG